VTDEQRRHGRLSASPLRGRPEKGSGCVAALVRATSPPCTPLLAGALLRAILAIAGCGSRPWAGIVRYADSSELERSIAEASVPDSVDSVLLVQDYVPARGGVITRVETLGGKFLYAIEVESGGETFDLCPADACAVSRGPIRMEAVTPPREIIAAAEEIARAAGLDVGGVEYMIDDRDGAARFYDINALSNFVAKPLDVLGWDPHDRLVDYLKQAIGKAR
jgi:hypothetical protein